MRGLCMPLIRPSLLHSIRANSGRIPSEPTGHRVAHRQVLDVMWLRRKYGRASNGAEGMLLEARSCVVEATATTRAVERRKQNLGLKQHGRTRMERVYNDCRGMTMMRSAGAVDGTGDETWRTVSRHTKRTHAHWRPRENAESGQACSAFRRRP